MPNKADDPKSRERQIAIVAALSGYPPEAFAFVLKASPKPVSRDLSGGHVNARELCWRVRDQALLAFGATARARLESWSIKSSEDVGEIVYAMVDHGLMAKTDQDSLDDFQGVFDFAMAFAADAKPRKGPSRFQWRL